MLIPPPHLTHTTHTPLLFLSSCTVRTPRFEESNGRLMVCRESCDRCVWCRSGGWEGSGVELFGVWRDCPVHLQVWSCTRTTRDTRCAPQLIHRPELHTSILELVWLRRTPVACSWEANPGDYITVWLLACCARSPTPPGTTWAHTQHCIARLNNLSSWSKYGTSIRWHITSCTNTNLELPFILNQAEFVLAHWMMIEKK